MVPTRCHIERAISLTPRQGRTEPKADTQGKRKEDEMHHFVVEVRRPV